MYIINPFVYYNLEENNMKQTDFDLLTSVYQNAEIAVQSIENLLPMVRDDNLREELKRQRKGYLGFYKHCQAVDTKKELKENNFFEKSRLWLSIKMTTVFDKSTRHIAEMMLLGTVMGTLQCYKDLSDHKKANEDIINLTNELLKLQERYFNRLKRFLRNV